MPKGIHFGKADRLGKTGLFTVILTEIHRELLLLFRNIRCTMLLYRRVSKGIPFDTGGLWFLCKIMEDFPGGAGAGRGGLKNCTKKSRDNGALSARLWGWAVKFYEKYRWFFEFFFPTIFLCLSGAGRAALPKSSTAGSAGITGQKMVDNMGAKTGYCIFGYKIAGKV